MIIQVLSWINDLFRYVLSTIFYSWETAKLSYTKNLHFLANQITSLLFKDEV